MKKIVLSIVMLAFFKAAFSQGCIPIRNLVGFGQFAKPSQDPLTGEPTKWFLNITQRYFKAHDTYSGTEYVREPDWGIKTTRVYLINFGVTRVFDKGWAVALDVPVLAGSRYAWRFEHVNPDSSKHTTHSFGLGDVRVTGFKWLWDVAGATRGNIQVGLGLKLPTGRYDYSDYFYTNPQSNTEKKWAPVNSAIQPGDGGTGITTEINAFYSLTRSIILYGNVFYLFNPRDVNGVSTTFGRDATVNQIASTSNVYSVPDSYTFRAGANVAVRNFTIWGGLRMEGSPVHDVIGKSNGQRRAGKTVSIDPGINYKFRSVTLYTFIPIPIHRQTRQTVPDQRISDLTGSEVPSPGGFVNVQLFLGMMFKL